jgi:tetratricopeptide (TPR) repeat protein
MKHKKRHHHPVTARPEPVTEPIPVAPAVDKRGFLNYPWLPGLLLLVITFLAYLPALHGGFIWDDDAHLTANPCVIGPLGLKELWTTRAARICPLVQTTFWLEYHLWGLRPLPYHLVNILVYALSGVALWRVLRALQVPGAWLGAALWALHPVQVESAAWVTEMKNTQSGLFYLLAVLFFVRWRRSPQAGWASEKFYVLALVCGALAMASKSSTVILPLVLGLCAWWVAGRWRWSDVWRLAPFLAVSAATGALSVWTQKGEGATGADYVRSLSERVVTAGDVVWFYLGKLLWPHPLIFIYPRWQIDAALAVSWLPVLGAGALLFLFWWNRAGWGRPFLFAFGYFVVCLLPVLGILNHYFLRYSFVGDHFQYLASMGALAAAGAGIWRALDFFSVPLLKPLVSAALLGVLGMLTWCYAPVFHDSETLWRDTLRKNPACWMAHNNLGTVLMAQKKTAEAAVHFRACLRLNPREVNAMDNLGDVFAREGRAANAMDYYHRALQIDPRKTQAFDGIGDVLVGQGRSDEAMGYYRRTLQINPRDLNALSSLGKALAASGKLAEAAVDLQRAVIVSPNSPENRCNLGNVLALQDKYPEAIQQYQEALRLKPDYSHAQNNLASAFEALGRLDDALAQYQAALRSDPDEVITRCNMGDLLLKMGRRDEAVAQFKEALRFQPDNAEARQQLQKLQATGDK